MTKAALSRDGVLKFLFFLFLFTIPAVGLAAEEEKSEAPAKSATGGSSGSFGERVKVSNLREKYWAKGEEAEFRVVQNRLYSKEGKIEIGGFYGMVNQDPFLSISTFGGSLGYYFSEFAGLRLLYSKYNTKTSSAYTDLTKAQLTAGGTTSLSGVNTNFPNYFYGAEASISPLYGKLSLLGSLIIYYDFHLLAGAGQTKTESGTYMTPFGGLSQQVYLGKRVSLRADIRFLYYKEKVMEKIDPAKLNTVAAQRSIWTNTVNLGLTYLFL